MQVPVPFQLSSGMFVVAHAVLGDRGSAGSSGIRTQRIAASTSLCLFPAPSRPLVVGKELGVGYVVEGSVRKDGDRLRIVPLSSLTTKNGEHVWAERFDRAGTDPWALQDEVTGMIVSAHSWQLS